jgi:hypothetical protein
LQRAQPAIAAHRAGRRRLGASSNKRGAKKGPRQAV